MNADEIKFRCSSLGHIMTEPRSKSETLSETCKVHLVDVFVRAKYGRQTDISNRFIEKGLMVEEDSITLFSRVNKQYFKKNVERLQNDFISGTPDLFTGKSINEAELVIDIKSSWDIFTFFRAQAKDLNKLYYWQLQGYMALTGAPSATLAYCLVNTPDILIQDELRKLQWKMGVIDPEASEHYKAAAKEIELLSIYDDIPLIERLFTIDFTRNDDDIERLYKRVADCRNYMNENLFKAKIQ